MPTSSPTQKQVFGQQGENVAADYLRSKGYDILARNWRGGKSEIDIIAKTDHTIVMVEVKTRKSDTFADPILSITPNKIRSLVRGVNIYMEQNHIDADVRIDVVIVVKSSGHGQNADETEFCGMRIEHIENAVNLSNV